ncbi:unnamed protein product [Rotaria sordida]|uniref:Uncharacterized protein n=1 Tax=Rotaria sordida TaxID=392033 RepID=A0A815S392_9BILA|nr:unnamed protein product [Rotaria sordida]CAF1650022.1 unnamed protein product [Rotaria sordida]
MYQNVSSIRQFTETFHSTIYRNVSIKLKYKLFFLFMYDSTADRNVQFNNLLKCSIQQSIEMCDSTTDRNVQFDNLSKRAIQQSIEMFDSTIY